MNDGELETTVGLFEWRKGECDATLKIPVFADTRLDPLRNEPALNNPCKNKSLPDL